MAETEPMNFDYSEITKQVTVVFRGKKTKLPGQYKDFKRAKAEAEDYARKLGWQG